MSKLHLIKPWQLQIVHQRLETIRNEEAISSLIPCTGPSGDYVVKNDPRKEKEIILHIKPHHAPVSDAIFAFDNNKTR